MKTIDDVLLLSKVHQWREFGTRIVLTNGCFDLLHVGHLRYLRRARQLGHRLIVALNSDESVAALKGPGRPILCLEDRAEMLEALPFVDHVVPFSERRVTKIIEALRPDTWVKGGDYTLETIDPEERAALEACHTEIVFLPFVEGRSTSDMIRRIRQGG